MKYNPSLKSEVAVAESATTPVSSALAKPFLHLFETSLNDIYSAEKHLLKVLPKMAKAANAAELRLAFESHLKQTEEHLKRLDDVFDCCDLNLTAGNCAGIEALTTEGDAVITEYPQGGIRDVCLIIAAQKVEHYEIAAYGALRSMAELLKLDEAVTLLSATLDEEESTDKLLTRISQTVNETAAHDSHGSMDGKRIPQRNNMK